MGLPVIISLVVTGASVAYTYVDSQKRKRQLENAIRQSRVINERPTASDEIAPLILGDAVVDVSARITHPGATWKSIRPPSSYSSLDIVGDLTGDFSQDHRYFLMQQYVVAADQIDSVLDYWINDEPHNAGKYAGTSYMEVLPNGGRSAVAEDFFSSGQGSDVVRVDSTSVYEGQSYITLILFNDLDDNYAYSTSRNRITMFVKGKNYAIPTGDTLPTEKSNSRSLIRNLFYYLVTPGGPRGRGGAGMPLSELNLPAFRAADAIASEIVQGRNTSADQQRSELDAVNADRGTSLSLAEWRREFGDDYGFNPFDESGLSPSPAFGGTSTSSAAAQAAARDRDLLRYECNMPLVTSFTTLDAMEVIMAGAPGGFLYYGPDGWTPVLPDSKTPASTQAKDTWTDDDFLEPPEETSDAAIKKNSLTLNYSDAEKANAKNSVTWPEPGSALHASLLAEDQGEVLHDVIDAPGPTTRFQNLANARTMVLVSRRRRFRIKMPLWADNRWPGDIVGMRYGPLGFDSYVMIADKRVNPRERSIEFDVVNFVPTDYAYVPHSTEDGIASAIITLNLPVPTELALARIGRGLFFIWDIDLDEAVHIRGFDIDLSKDDGMTWNRVAFVGRDARDYFHELSTDAGDYILRIRTVPERGRPSDWVVSNSTLVSPIGEGRDGAGREFIFRTTETDERPATPVADGTMDDQVPAGWHDDLQDVNSIHRYQWVSYRRGTSMNWMPFSTPRLWNVFGQDGNGYEFAYIRTTTTARPRTPTSDRMVDESLPTGYTDDPQGVDITNRYEWFVQRKGMTGDWSEWSAPALWANFGLDGRGRESIFRRTATDTPPDTPASTEEQRAMDDFVPVGWTDNQQGITDELPYEWISTRTGMSGDWSEFSTPVLWSLSGKDGAGVEFVFTRTRDATPPDAIVTTTEQRGTDDFVPPGWTDDPVGPDAEFPVEWTAIRREPRSTDISWSEFSEPSVWARHAEDGRRREVLYTLTERRSAPRTIDLSLEDESLSEIARTNNFVPQRQGYEIFGTHPEITDGQPFRWVCDRVFDLETGGWITPTQWVADNSVVGAGIPADGIAMYKRSLADINGDDPGDVSIPKGDVITESNLPDGGRFQPEEGDGDLYLSVATAETSGNVDVYSFSAWERISSGGIGTDAMGMTLGVEILNVVSVPGGRAKDITAVVTGTIGGEPSYVWSVASGGGTISGTGATATYVADNVTRTTMVEVEVAVTRGTLVVRDRETFFVVPDARAGTGAAQLILQATRADESGTRTQSFWEVDLSDLRNGTKLLGDTPSDIERLESMDYHAGEYLGLSRVIRSRVSSIITQNLSESDVLEPLPLEMATAYDSDCIIYFAGKWRIITYRQSQNSIQVWDFDRDDPAQTTLAHDFGTTTDERRVHAVFARSGYILAVVNTTNGAFLDRLNLSGGTWTVTKGTVALPERFREIMVGTAIQRVADATVHDNRLIVVRGRAILEVNEADPASSAQVSGSLPPTDSDGNSGIVFTHAICSGQRPLTVEIQGDDEIFEDEGTVQQVMLGGFLTGPTTYSWGGPPSTLPGRPGYEYTASGLTYLNGNYYVLGELHSNPDNPSFNGALLWRSAGPGQTLTRLGKFNTLNVDRYGLVIYNNRVTQFSDGNINVRIASVTDLAPLADRTDTLPTDIVTNRLSGAGLGTNNIAIGGANYYMLRLFGFVASQPSWSLIRGPLANLATGGGLVQLGNIHGLSAEATQRSDVPAFFTDATGGIWLYSRPDRQFFRLNSYQVLSDDNVLVWRTDAVDGVAAPEGFGWAADVTFQNGGNFDVLDGSTGHLWRSSTIAGFSSATNLGILVDIRDEDIRPAPLDPNANIMGTGAAVTFSYPGDIPDTKQSEDVNIYSLVCRGGVCVPAEKTIRVRADLPPQNLAVAIDEVTDVFELNTQQLRAVVTGDNLDRTTLTYVWTVESGGGTITGDGATVTYNPPNVETVTPVRVKVVVTGMNTRGTRTATAEDTEDFNVEHDRTLTVAVSGPTTVTQGVTYTFGSTLGGNTVGTPTYAWSIRAGGGTLGAITNADTVDYTPAAGASAATLRLTVTREGETTTEDHILAVEPPSLTVEIANVNSVTEGNTQIFMVTPTVNFPDPLTYAWEVVSGGGTFTDPSSRSASYVAPEVASNTPAQVRVTVTGRGLTATDTEDFTVIPVVISALSIMGESSMNAAATQTLVPQITHTGAVDPVYTWTVLSGDGTVAQNGMFTAPDDVAEGSTKTTTVELTANVSGTIRTATLAITATYVFILSVEIAGPDSVFTDETPQLTANLIGNDIDRSSAAYTWSVAGTPRGTAFRRGGAFRFGGRESFPSGMASINNTLYATFGRALYVLNTTTGESTRVGPRRFPENFGVTGNFINPVDLTAIGNTLYMLTNTALYTLDIDTGAATLVGNLNFGLQGFVPAVGLASIGNTLYVVGSSSQPSMTHLFTLNTSTAASTLVASATNLVFPRWLESIGNTLYMAPDSQNIYTLDTSTAQITFFTNPTERVRGGIAAVGTAFYFASATALYVMNTSATTGTVTGTGNVVTYNPPSSFTRETITAAVTADNTSGSTSGSASGTKAIDVSVR